MLLAANTANQSVDHRPSVLQAAPQFSHYLSTIGNCPMTASSTQTCPADLVRFCSYMHELLQM